MADERAKNCKLVAVNEKGLRIGESHPRSVLTDRDIELMFALRDEDPARWSYGELARKFEVSKGCVWKVFQGLRRGQIAARVKRVRTA